MALSTGYTGYDANIGTMRNRGVDVDVRTIPVRNENLRWNLDFNISHFKNKITEMPQEEGNPRGNKMLRVGGSLYDFYLPTWAGVNPENRSPQWY